jgi:3-phenylpropionate/trans-cinnamate dioxygenase ferredoxin reductase component
MSGLVVVGSGPAGLSAARAFREAGGRGPVRIVTHDAYPPYNRPPLSKDFLRGESGPDDLPLEDASFYTDQDIELLLGTEVVGIDVPGRAVLLGEGRRLEFETCVLATGSAPGPLPVPGGDHPDLFVLRGRNHAHRLRDAATAARRAVVVGSGFIGCEASASLAARGVEVTMVSTEELPQQERLGHDVAERIASWLHESGVEIVGGRSVEAVEDGRTVRLDDGSRRSGDLVLVATGAVPQGHLAEEAGLPGSEGRVLVDERMRTGIDGVLVAGDIACAFNPTAGRRLAVEHWGEALRMGEVAGTTAAGGDDAWTDVPGFWSEIGERVVKYAAWGDGYDEVRFAEHGDGAFTAWYGRDGVLVGVLTHEADDDYERGQALVGEGRDIGVCLRPSSTNSSPS